MTWNFTGTPKQVAWAEDIMNRQLAKLDEFIQTEEEKKARMIAIHQESGYDATPYISETHIDCDKLVAYRKTREHIMKHAPGAAAKEIIDSRDRIWDGIHSIISHYRKEREDARNK